MNYPIPHKLSDQNCLSDLIFPHFSFKILILLKKYDICGLLNGKVACEVAVVGVSAAANMITSLIMDEGTLKVVTNEKGEAVGDVLTIIC
jgi:hypothetical protein